MINLSDFSECVKDLMNERKIDVKTLENKVRINADTIHLYLRGDILPSLQSAIKLADFFECSIEYLLARTAVNNPNANKSIPPFCERLKFIYNHFESNENKLIKGTKISRASTYSWLYKKMTPSIDSLAKIADFYNTTIDFVIGRE